MKRNPVSQQTETGLDSEVKSEDPAAPSSCIPSPFNTGCQQLTPLEHSISAQARPEEICSCDLVLDSLVTMATFLQRTRRGTYLGQRLVIPLLSTKVSGTCILNIPDSAVMSASLLILVLSILADPGFKCLSAN